MNNNTSLWDNWALEDLAYLFDQGIDYEDSNKLIIDRKKNSYYFESINSAVLQLECLFALINELILRENIFYDQKFSKGWQIDKNLKELDKHILIPIDIPTFNQEVYRARERAIDILCVTDKMKVHQKENENEYKISKKSPHSYFGQVVWGAAGNLGRSALLGSAYIPHPIRASLLNQAHFFNRPIDINSKITDWIKEERIKIFTNLTPAGKQDTLEIILPPLVSEVIEQCNNLKDLIPTTLNLREKYSKVREWISEYQESIISENPKKILNFQKTLNLVSKDINDRKNNGDLGSTSIGISFFSIDLPTKSLPSPGKYFGIRSAFSKLILNKRGNSALSKLMKWFDCSDQKIEDILKNHFKE
ncbi:MULTISPECIES: hypothetical protein [Leptospira]|uniref:Uncharacterized protein n=1 Tax=Leptospira limi TaxID=2950023 RepID=A0ABT3M1Z9_9LEPT|nr:MULTISPECIES: hypothetical protein [Leptospira]MCW7464001.1 hypothetical protein [Leptospira limi]TGK92559.1 hypothetical protein EHQ34_18265 [Leptospira levettii]